MTNTIPRALIDALPRGIEPDDCTMTTVAALESGYDIDIDIAGDAPALLLPGWFADDGNAEIHIPDANFGEGAAWKYVEGGDWGDERNRTNWIDVWAWRRALVLDEDGRVVTIEIDRDRHTVAIDPKEPDCTRDVHDWRERDVRGHGGGVIITEICVHCSRYRIIDTWAQRRDTGEQGLEAIEYREPDEISREWVEARHIPCRACGTKFNADDVYFKQEDAKLCDACADECDDCGRIQARFELALTYGGAVCEGCLVNYVWSDVHYEYVRRYDAVTAKDTGRTAHQAYAAKYWFQNSAGDWFEDGRCQRALSSRGG